MRCLSLIGLVICAILAIWAWRTGLLTSQQAMSDFVRNAGFWGSALFLILQAVQVVIPVLPGGIGCLVGVLVFGPVWGFVYNYIGICAGSLAAFAIARNCGRPLLYRMFPRKMIDRYDRWTNERGRFARWFAFLIFIPVAPDDYLCFLAGTTEISWRLYTAIILLCKPFAIAIYSLGLTVLFQQVLGLWR